MIKNKQKSFPQKYQAQVLEDKISEFWQKNKIFQKSVDQRPSKKTYTFYDGPPFVTGSPHYGHLCSSVAKDVIPRFWAMKGYRCERKWGWDCHGLPIEEKVEKQLGSKNKRDIEEKIGLQKFTEACYKYVAKTSEDWEWYIKKIGRWVDMDNAYRTLDRDYMETVMWVFKQLYDKGLVYEGHKTLLYCTRCGTPVSKFEIAMDNSYADMEDPSVVVKFKAKYHKSGVGVGAIIENKQGQILMMKRSEPGRDHVWGIVGGKIEPTDKNISATVQREVQEELNVTASITSYHGFSIDIFEGRLFKTYHFKVSVQGDLQINEPQIVSELKWFSPKDLPWDNMHIPTKNTLRNVLNNKTVIDIPTELSKPDVHILAWTTTPWTLPANVGLAVKDSEFYETVYDKHTDNYFILAKALHEKVFNKYDKSEDLVVIDEYLGKELTGLSYEPLMTFALDNIAKIKNNDKNFKIYPANFVSMQEGTGLVHIAPAFGEEDNSLGREIGLSMISHVDDEGKITTEIQPWKGLYFKKADPSIIEFLQERNLLFKSERITHSYPYCSRCKTPLLQKAVHSWFINIQKIKKQLLENNKNINWVPEHIKEGRFKHVLETAPDWSISRTRYWGSPMPVWRCDKTGEITVIGSVAELEKLSGQKVPDLHRPYIDKVTWKNKKTGGTMCRIPEILDCWMESGSMPYGQLHYPFANKEFFSKNFPADYIVEYTSQTRAWFYVLHAVSTALHGSHCFKNVIVHGTIAGNDGRKMSKSYGNYPDPKQSLQKYGADSLRLYLLGSSLFKGEDIVISEDQWRLQNQMVIMPLFNSMKYFMIYAQQHDFFPQTDSSSSHILDKWIVTRCQQLINNLDQHLTNYHLPLAINELAPFVDDLSAWYIKRSRDRFVAGDVNALQTLFQVLLMTIKAVAPIIPFMSEIIYQSLLPLLPPDQQIESIHLTNFPTTKKITKQQIQLLAEMNVLRKLSSLGHSIRVETQTPVKQPLGIIGIKETTLLSNLFNTADSQWSKILVTDLNVKDIVLYKDKPPTTKITPTNKWIIKQEDNLKVALNLYLTPELKMAGQLRNLMRTIQKLRRVNNLEISQKVTLIILKDTVRAKKLIMSNQEVLQNNVGLKTIEFVENTTLETTKLDLNDGVTMEIGLSVN